ncbi:MAG: DUF2341 domain-containing protein, partial [Smithella sp.]|nr:DUF2341 domain-containing protein [Smithella sp.]
MEYDSSNYQLRVALTSENFDFATPDSQGNDIRFTGALARTSYDSETERLNAQATNEISYYKESYNQAGKTAVFWINLPSIYSFWGVSTEDSGTDTKLKVDDISGFPDPADFPNGEIPVTVADTSNTEINYITAIDGDTKELTFKNNFANNYLTSKMAQVKYIEDEQIYLYYGNSNATVSTQTNILAESNLKGLWKFEENTGTTAIDDSGNSNTGTFKTGLEPTWTTGKKGHALSFVDGHYIELGTSSTLKPSSAITVEFWKKENSLHDAGIYGYISGYGNGVFIGTWDAGGYYFCLQGLSCTFFTASRSSTEWQHIAATYDGQYKRFYINGIKVREEEIVGTIGYPSDGPTLGYHYGGYNIFEGYIDELKVYNRALTVEEILAQYNADLSSSPTYLSISSTVGTSTSLYSSIWQYQRAITIDNSAGGNLTNYQIKINDLDTATLVTAGKMKDNCWDIRFADNDATTELNYWIESGCNTATTDIWVKVPSISASSTKTIYMYYGNIVAPAASNMVNTGVLFDNFNDGDITNNPTWTDVSTAGSVEWSENKMHVIAGGTYDVVETEARTASNVSYGIWQWESTPNMNRWTRIIFLYKDSNNYYYIIHGAGNTDQTKLYKVKNGASTLINTLSTRIDGPRTFKVTRALDNTFNIYYSDQSSADPVNFWYSFIESNIGHGEAVYFYLGATDSTNNYFDNVEVHPDPTVVPATVNSETATAWPSSEVAKLILTNNTGQNYATLTSFAETLTGDNAGSVKYQISNNGTDWYWYNSGSTDWEAASGLIQTNTAADINTNVSTFDDDIHPGEIGTFYFKSFFISDGTQKVELDSVDLGYIYDT